MNLDDYEGHTPGPWAYCEDEVYAEWSHVTLTLRSVPFPVALRAHGSNGELTSKLPHRWADFALIAAAPDLLAEVKRLTTMLNIAENNIPRSIHWDCYWEALVEAGLETIEDEDEWGEEE